MTTGDLEWPFAIASCRMLRSGVSRAASSSQSDPKMTIDQAVIAVRDAYDADLLIYAGPMLRPMDDDVIGQIIAEKERKNVIFWLTTYGGDPTVAYRIARALRKHYDKITIYVNSSCYSAGTMLTLVGDSVIIDEHAEFGPIDVQLLRRDEVGERISGLTSRGALALATDETPETFQRIFKLLRRQVGLSTKMAADVACELTDSTIGKLFAQIDPMRLAEDSRSVKVIESYAERIASANIKDGAIKSLVNSYPDHNFVIDPQEAREVIFKNPEAPCDELRDLGNQLKSYFSRYLYSDDPVALFLKPDPISPNPDPDHEDANENEQTAGATGTGTGVQTETGAQATGTEETGTERAQQVPATADLHRSRRKPNEPSRRNNSA